jgi:TolB-like protein/DNA-binding SARP family transcriptional activator
MAIAELRLLGGFELRLAGGEVIDLLGQKDRALLAILALPAGGAHARDKLASLLWSDRGDQQARDSLKHSLTKLRQCWPSTTDVPIVADRLSARLDPSAVTIDVAEFERLAREGTPQALERAIALYHGDLLDGIGIHDPAFEEWLLVERQRVRHLFEEALTKQIKQSMADGARERAGTAARRLLSLDPLREDACRALMQIHAERGEMAQALKLHEALRERLHGELGVKPAPETTQLYDAILHRRAASGPSQVINKLETPSETAGRLPLPDKPSIAVLPFENFSNDPEQEYFADGMVEEIITGLSRMRSLTVIARNSSFYYKGRSTNAKQVGRELGVRYILEGSVRKVANRVRITGQLIEAETGANLWADRFDGDMEDIFDLQDQMTARVIGAIAPKLAEAEIERVRSKPTESLDAYDCFLRGMAALHKWSREGNDEALAHFYRAIEIDPTYAVAHGLAARTYVQREAGGWTTDRQHELTEASRLARRAVDLGHDDAVALSTAGFALAVMVGEIEDGDAFIDAALALNPNLAWAWLYSGWVKALLGDTDLAIECIARAKRLSPHDPQDVSIQTALSFAHFIAERYGEALTCAQAASRNRPQMQVVHCLAAASATLAGRPDEARKAAERLRTLDPHVRLADARKTILIRRLEDLARWTDALRKAGLSD